MIVFPYFILRISGDSFNQFDKLTLNKSKIAFENLSKLFISKDILKKHLVNELYNSISKLKDKNLQNTLLNLKRDIHNERQLTSEQYSIITNEVNNDLENLLMKLDVVKNDIINETSIVSDIYLKELRSKRAQLVKLASLETFQKGLVMSSNSLIERLNIYIQNYEKPNKSLKRTEISLIKYLSRMYLKTSPFSTFTNLALGTFSKNKKAKAVPFDFNCRKSSVKSHLRLNNAIFVHIRDLLFKIPSIYHNFNVRLNPSIRKENENYVYLINSINVESFQRVKISPVIELISRLIKKRNSGVKFVDLINQVIEKEYVGESFEKIEQIIIFLIDCGYIEFDLGFSGLDAVWDLKLIEVLKDQKENVVIKDLIDFLHMLGLSARQFEKSNVHGRRSTLNLAFSHFKEICEKLSKHIDYHEDESQTNIMNNGSIEEKFEGKQEIFKKHFYSDFYFRPEHIYYEDTTWDISPKINLKKIEKSIESIKKLFNLLQVFDSRSDELKIMKIYFEETFGSNTEIDFLEFYENFYRDYKTYDKNIHAMTENETKFIPSYIRRINDYIQTKKESMEKVFEKTRQQLEDKTLPLDTIDIDSNFFEYSISHLNHLIKPSTFSSAIFTQLYFDKTERGSFFVVNTWSLGYGKMMSRFLHLFDNKVTKELKRQNRRVNKEALLVENSDSSVHNANLHPPLFSYEIEIPGGNNILPRSKHIPIRDIQISIDNKSGELILTHKKWKKRIYVFDIAFQNLQGRSELYSLLQNFTICKQTNYRYILNEINSVFSKKHSEINPKIREKMYPRIVYEGNVILQRRFWIIEKEDLPRRLKNESDCDFFVKINIWKNKLQFPDEVFVFFKFNSLEPTYANVEEDNKTSKWDDFKPQYINWYNPFLILLLEKSIEKVDKQLKIEEMLPTSRDLLEIDGRRFITESLIQWY